MGRYQLGVTGGPALVIGEAITDSYSSSGLYTSVEVIWKLYNYETSRGELLDKIWLEANLGGAQFEQSNASSGSENAIISGVSFYILYELLRSERISVLGSAGVGLLGTDVQDLEGYIYPSIGGNVVVKIASIGQIDLLANSALRLYYSDVGLGVLTVGVALAVPTPF